MTQPSQYPGPYQPGPVYPQTYPGQQPSPPPKAPMSLRKKGLLLVSGALVVFLVAFLTIGIVKLSSGSHHTMLANHSLSSSLRESSSDEAQIRQTMANMAEAAKARDFKKFASYACAKYRDILESLGDPGNKIDLGSLTKSHGGPVTITKIDVNGDTAQVHLTSSKRELVIQFVKENGSWKFCPA